MELFRIFFEKSDTINRVNKIIGLSKSQRKNNTAPIDGGLGLLAAAGGAYALKKLNGKKKSREEAE